MFCQIIKMFTDCLIKQMLKIIKRNQNKNKFDSFLKKIEELMDISKSLLER